MNSTTMRVPLGVLSRRTGGAIERCIVARGTTSTPRSLVISAPRDGRREVRWPERGPAKRMPPAVAGTLAAPARAVEKPYIPGEVR
jgi:hypothetical protein